MISNTKDRGRTALSSFPNFSFLAPETQTSLMKIRKNIYLVLAILCIALDIILTISDIDDLTKVATAEEYTIIDKLAYFTGFQVLLLIGILFSIGVYRVQKKINRKNHQTLENAFND